MTPPQEARRGSKEEQELGGFPAAENLRLLIRSTLDSAAYDWHTADLGDPLYETDTPLDDHLTDAVLAALSSSGYVVVSRSDLEWATRGKFIQSRIADHCGDCAIASRLRRALGGSNGE